jgi:multimeric flavodoxin WrbA
MGDGACFAPMPEPAIARIAALPRLGWRRNGHDWRSSKMPRVAIVFHTVTGHTAQTARAIGEGVADAGAEPVLLAIHGRDIVEGRYDNPAVLSAVDGASAVVFGAPTFMGGPSAQFKAFADASSDRWERQLWRNKLAAGFTTGTAPNGDQAGTLQYFVVLAAQHGMLWVSIDKPCGVDPGAPNTFGVQLGFAAAVGSAGVAQADLRTARYLGARVGQLVASDAGRTI